MKRKTRVLLEIVWDDERDDHPAGWDYRTLLEGNPFTGPSSDGCRMLSFEDYDEQGVLEQT